MDSPVSASAFQKTADSIQSNTEKVMNDINNCVDKFNNRGKWGSFTMWLHGKLDDVLKALNELVQKFEEFANYVAQLLSPGNPVAMIDMAKQWRDVQLKLSGQVAELSASRFPATYSWGGRDGWAYGGIVTDQSAALSGIYPHASAMAGHLESHALDVIDGWTDIAADVLRTQLDVAKDAGAFITADPLKWLDIVPLIITLVADLVQNVADGFDQLEKYATNALASMQALQGDLSDVSGSRGGVWPTADFSVAD